MKGEKLPCLPFFADDMVPVLLAEEEDMGILLATLKDELEKRRLEINGVHSTPGDAVTDYFTMSNQSSPLLHETTPWG